MQGRVCRIPNWRLMYTTRWERRSPRVLPSIILITTTVIHGQTSPLLLLLHHSSLI
jgi:hypothetical protein